MTEPDPVLRPDVRQDVAIRLRAALPDLAGRIHAARRWPSQGGSYPRLLVYMLQERMTNRAEAGGAPYFRVDATLAIQVRDEAADEEALETALNCHVAALKAALLQDAAWVALFESIPSVDITLKLDDSGETLLGDATMLIALQWNEDQFPLLPYALATASLQASPGDPDAPVLRADFSIPTS